jgi:hypothetical protein
VQVNALGPVPVKGLPEPVEVFDLTRASAVRRRLQAIAELPEAELYRGLARLQATEFLYETHLFPERAYTFKHALTHEVAYGSLLLERRRTLHAGIVEALERLAPDRLAEQVERLAHHALRGEVWDKALAYCRQAGEKALARSVHHEAVGYVEQVLSVLPHPTRRHPCRPHGGNRYCRADVPGACRAGKGPAGCAPTRRRRRGSGDFLPHTGDRASTCVVTPGAGGVAVGTAATQAQCTLLYD